MERRTNRDTRALDKNISTVKKQNTDDSVSAVPSIVGASLHCAVRGCIFSRADMVTGQVRFFGAPQCANLLQIWKKACGYIIEDTFSVCDRHFAPSDFIRRYDVLKLEAVPSLHLVPLGDKVKSSLSVVEDSKLAAVCAVQSCIYSQAGTAPKHIRFFPAPLCDDHLRSCWKKACGYANGNFFTVCERHFTHEDFIKRHNSLKRKAVPSLHLGTMNSGQKRYLDSTSDDDRHTQVNEKQMKLIPETLLHSEPGTGDDTTRIPFIKTEQEYIDTSPRHCDEFDDNDDFHTEFHEILPDTSPHPYSYPDTCMDPLLETKPVVAPVSSTNTETAPDGLSNCYIYDYTTSSAVLNIKEEAADYEEQMYQGDEPTSPRNKLCDTALKGNDQELVLRNHTREPFKLFKPEVDQNSSSSAKSSSGSSSQTQESLCDSDSEGVPPIFSENPSKESAWDTKQVCAVRGCINARPGSILPFMRLYPSPRSKPDLYAWNTACGYHPCEFRDSLMVCGRHFKSSDFRVKDGAVKYKIVPSLHLRPDVRREEATEFTESCSRLENPLSVCAVRSCVYSRVAHMPPHVLLYPAPELKSIRDMWKYHCGYRPHEISDSFSVCCRHFSSTNFQKRDGILRPKAVPTLHSDSPELEDS